MTTRTRKRTTRPTVRKSKGKSKSKLHWLLSVLVVFLVLGAIALAAAYVYVRTNQDKKTETPFPTTEVKQKSETTNETLSAEDSSLLKTLEGTWVSTAGGAMLTLKGDTFSLDFPSVEAEKPMSGSFGLSGMKISVTNKGKSICGETTGTYSINIVSGDLVIKLLHDECSKRKNTLQATWYKL